MSYYFGHVAVLFVALSAGLSSVQAQAEVETKLSPFWAERKVGYITAKDGTKLRFTALLPKGSGKFPVLVKYSGYNGGAIGSSAYLQGLDTFSVGLDKSLLENGYAIVGVQARGTGCSEGNFDFLPDHYGTDGRDAIEFISEQSWSTGNVGMYAWSWGGMSQLMTASERPKGLKAIAPGMVLGDAKADNFSPGGIPSPQFFSSWQLFVDDAWNVIESAALEEGDEKCLSQLKANREGILQTNVSRSLLKHPYRDSWINEQTIRKRTEKIEVPVLSMKAWQDEAVVSREGYYQETLQSDLLWQVQTNGPHDIYESLFFRKKLINFFDHFVKSIDNGFPKEPRVEIWQDTSSGNKNSLHEINESARPSWVIASSYPVPTVVKRFWLTGNGELSTSVKPNDAPREYTYPVEVATVNAGYAVEGWGKLNSEWKKGSLAYTSTTFSNHFVSYGPGSADLWLQADTVPDFDVQVTITEVLPSGEEKYVQRGWLRTSTRKLDSSKTTELRPYRTDEFNDIEPIPLNKPFLARVEIQPFSHTFRKGSKVRIWIDAPGITGSFAFNRFSVETKVKLFNDSEHQSSLALGELENVEVKAPLAKCESSLMEPCRKDPLAN